MIKQPGLYKRRTKIVCTIGPASGSSQVIERLLRTGMNVARLNLSHGSYDVHSGYIIKIRAASRRLGIPVAIMMDISGPKYRTGKLKEGQVFLRKGARITITTEDIEGNAELISVNLPNLTEDVKAGDTILLDDGALQLRVLGKDSGSIKCRVTVGGVLTENRGLVVPGMRSSVPFITESLRMQLLFAIKENVDYLAVSFVSSAEDISGVIKILRENRADIPVITKIERVQAVKNFDSILAASDGIMVARGDLGVDIPLERVPLVQKEIIHKCNRAGKPVITATQMLESMVNAARPTRAEVTDISNAIFDGTDAIMLSAETSIGKYPVAAVRTMSKIALETERVLAHEDMLEEKEKWIERKTDELISYSACHTAQSLGAVAVVAFTKSGSTARRVSKYRPRVPILAITPIDTVHRRLLLHWGIYPFQIAETSAIEDYFSIAAGLARDTGIARPGNLIVITGGVPVGVTGSTNLLKVEEVK